MKNFKVFLLIILGISLVLTAKLFFTGVSAQTSADSSDAIAVRIIANPNHYSIMRWYESQGFSGAPQALTVDGYEAIRDGRTVYINATNVEGKNIYTNVYLISYNQSSNVKTVDILGQIVSHWKFNSNIVESVNPVPSCSISNKNCSSNSDCGADQICASAGSAASSCVLKTTKNCLIDSDCPSNFFCNSLKSKIIRDAKRIGQLEELKEALYKYKGINNRFPTLGAGTYLANHSVSVWPSWSQNFLANLAVSANFLDPINRLGNCPGYDVKTCWNNNSNKFVFNSSPSYLMLPAGSYAFVYKGDANGSNYNLCATIESRDPALDYHFAPNDPSSSACLLDTGVITGGTAGNTAPYLVDKFLSGEAGQEFNGYLRVFDRENNPLTWTLLTSGTAWTNWRNNNINNAAPILKDTNDVYQKKVYAALAGDPGDYALSFKVDDGHGGILSTSTIIKITNSAPLIEADDGEYVLSAYTPFSYSFTFSDSNLGNPETSFSVTKVSGPFDLWAESKTASFTSVGVNKYKVTHSGIISSAHKFAQDTLFTYQIKVTDRYNAVSTKNFTIKVVVEKPVLDFNCPAKARIGKNYSCILGPSFSADRQTIDYSAAGSLLADLAINKNTESLFWVNGIARVLGLLNTTINAVDEYGVSSAKPFSLRVDSYCGDGKKEFPNTEGQGGFYNDGYEDCDGLDGITSSPADSSITRQYACSTKLGETTPDIITSQNYCTFLSALNGGGYCGDGYCSSIAGGGPESSCNCPQDCGPSSDCSTPIPVCNYTYLWGACQPNNTKTGVVIDKSPAGCVGDPVLTQNCTYAQNNTPVECTSWTYTDWSECSAYSQQTRSILSSSPAGCSGGYPLLSKSCTYTPATCDFTYGDWTLCSSSGQQTRPVVGSYPAGCTGGTPITSQSCTYVPNACTYTYSSWSNCSTSGTQTRTVLSSSPSGCTGTPLLSQTCTYTPPACTYTYSGWGACLSSNQQTRSVLSSSPSGCSGTPVLSQTCIYTAPTCTYTYSGWGACSASGQQTRTVTGSTPSGCSGTPVLSQGCTPPPNACTYTYSGWSNCSTSGTQTRTVLSSSPSGCSGTPVLSGTCTPPPTACTFTYSDWSACSASGTHTRTVIGSTPAGCSSTPIVSETCTYCGPGFYVSGGICVSGCSSDAGCSSSISHCVNNTCVQCVSNADCPQSAFLPNFSCTGQDYYWIWRAYSCSSDPNFAPNSCVYTDTSYYYGTCSSGTFCNSSTSTCDPIVPCTSWTFTNWGACEPSGFRYHQVLTSNPPGCSGGPQTLSEPCNYSSVCGDGFCTFGEDCVSCPADCGTCSCSADQYCPGGYCSGWAGYCTGCSEPDQWSCDRCGHWNITALGTCVY